ncbi:MAG: hypothetical protein AB7O52_14350 [Planctomycetota bacterium]
MNVRVRRGGQLGWVVALAILGVSTVVEGQCVTRLFAPDFETDDQFGRAVALDDRAAVFGAPGGDDGGANSGVVYVYGFNGTSWSFRQKLLAVDLAAGDSFGRSVAIHGDEIVVGAPNEDQGGTNAGAAYVFTFNGVTWTQRQKLVASDSFAFDGFGASVAIDDDVIVVGAPNAHGPDPEGLVYVFRRSGTTWIQEQILSASDGVGFDNFGVSVDVSGESIVVGANLNNGSAGSAYVFEFNGASWTQQLPILTGNDTGVNDEFGASVAIDGDVIIIGAERENQVGPSAGAAYLFRRSPAGWSQEQKLIAEFAFDRFGAAVAIDGGFAAVGAPSASGPDPLGRAYSYRFDGTSWLRDRTLDTLSPSAFNLFGGAVAVAAGSIVVGHPFGHTAGAFNTGAADVFGRPASTTFRSGAFDGFAAEVWCEVDGSQNGAVDLAGGMAEVTGGDDGSGAPSQTYVQQAFDLHTGSIHRIGFAWSFSTVDLAGFDGAFWDLIDVSTGLSVVGGPVTLASANGASGVVNTPFAGEGQYLLRLGTFTVDNTFGPGISTFSGVSVVCDELPGPLTNGTFADPTGIPWCVRDASRNGSVDFVDGGAQVTGGDDSATSAATVTFTSLDQDFTTAPGSSSVSFSWSYESIDAPGFDAASWDLIDLVTGLTVVAGPITLSDTSGQSGTETQSFTGSGQYRIRVGVLSADNLFGPGRLTLDNIALGGGGASFVRGDANADGAFNLADVVSTLSFLFSAGTMPPCLDAADANDDSNVNVSDPVSSLARLFSAGPPLPAPHPNCGADPTADGLGCASFPPCP